MALRQDRVATLYERFRQAIPGTPERRHLKRALEREIERRRIRMAQDARERR